METPRDPESLDADRGGWLYLLGRIGVRLFQAALVIAGVWVVAWVVLELVAPDTHDRYGKEKAYRASMRADLRILVTAQEAYFAEHATYSPSIGSLQYSPSMGSTLAINSATGTGWAATAKNVATTGTCGIYVGGATAPVPGQKEGEPKCL